MRSRMSWLDFKLGARMLARYPGLSVVGGLALAVGIGLGAGYLEVVHDFVDPELPLPEGERIVGLQKWDLEEGDPDLRSLHEFHLWREELQSVREISAFRSIQRNVTTGDARTEPVTGAAITASAFPLTRVSPALGRTLVEADERQGAAEVVVLGHRL